MTDVSMTSLVEGTCCVDEVRELEELTATETTDLLVDCAAVVKEVETVDPFELIKVLDVEVADDAGVVAIKRRGATGEGTGMEEEEEAAAEEGALVADPITVVVTMSVILSVTVLLTVFVVVVTYALV